MTEEKQKFILELTNYFNNISHYSVGEVLFSLMNRVGEKGNLLKLTNSQLTIKLEQAQYREQKEEPIKQEE